MPLTTAPEAFEAFGSQPFKVTEAGKGNNLRLLYFVTGTGDRDIAYATLLAKIQTVELLRGVLPVVADTIEMKEIAPEIWEASIGYVAPEDQNSQNQPKAIGECTFEFDGTGGTVNIREAYAQTKYGTNAPDHKKAINVTADGVAGVDVVIPSLSFSVHQRFDGATITLPWLRTLVGLTGRTNDDTFLGFEAGEILFLGPAGQQPFHFNDNGTVTAGQRDVTFRFTASPNLTGLEFGSITGVDKKGHEYLWIHYEDKEDSTASALTREPLGVYVGEVYPEDDLSQLAINDPDTDYPVAG